MKCNECATLYPELRMDNAELAEYWGQTIVANSAILEPFSPVHLQGDRIIRTMKQLKVGKYLTTGGLFCTSKMMRMIRKRVKRGKSLDIGTRDGSFVYNMNALGFDAYGLEPFQVSVNNAASQGLKVKLGNFPHDIPYELEGMKFSLISILDTHYYFNDLKASLNKAHAMLDDGGVLLLRCHQAESVFYELSGASLFKRYGDTVQTLPTWDGLRNCLCKSGFSVDYEFGITQLDHGFYTTPILLRLPLPGKMLKWLGNKLYNILLPKSKADRIVIFAGKQG